jgi:hypothetical protein
MWCISTIVAEAGGNFFFLTSREIEWWRQGTAGYFLI